MAISEAFQNSTTVGVTEYFLAANSTTQGSGQATDAMVQLLLDLNALQNGDEFRVSVYDAISSSGTSRRIASWVISNAQTDANWMTPAMLLLHKWDFSITKMTGTDRSIAWSIRTAT